MIDLNINLYMLTQLFNIPASRLKAYENKSVEEIIDLEAASGNKKAQEFDKEILQDPQKMIEFFKLDNYENKTAILENLNSTDLKNILPMLENEQLIVGLNFYTTDALFELMKELPKEELTKMMFNKFSPEKFLSLTNEKELNKFFDSDKIKKEDMVKHLDKIPDEILFQMYETITGMPLVEPNKDEIINNISSLNDNAFKRAMKVMEPEGKMTMIFEMGRIKPEVYEEFSPEALTNPYRELDKEEIITNMAVLEQKNLLNMVTQLPDDLMAIVASQIDTTEFAKLLYKEFREVLSKIAIGNI